MIKNSSKYYLLIIVTQLAFIEAIRGEDSTEVYKNYTLDEVFVSSNKLDTKLKDVSTKIDIIDEKAIERSNGNRLPDVLKYSGSTFIKQYGISPALQTISVNGLGAEHTLILMDGVRLNSFQNSHIDLTLIPLENIERIEIINNGVSSIYGSDALGGVVNIIPKRREMLDESFKLDASLTNGSYNLRRYHTSFYTQSKNFNSNIYYTRETSDGNFEYYFDNGIDKIKKERENAAYSIYDVGINTQYIVNESNIVRFISSYTDQDKEIPGIETGNTPPPTKQLDRNWNNILIIENTLSEETSLRSSINYQNNYMKYKVEPFIDNFFKNLVYSGSSELRFKKESYGLTTGYNYSHALIDADQVAPGIKRNQHAMFVSSFYNLTDQFKLFPSMRYDYISDIKEGAFTYKLGFNFQPLKDFDLRIRGNAGKNFRAPSFNDLYWKVGGNPDLKPENSVNTEAGILYSFSSFVDAQFDFTFAFIDARDKIVWRPQSGAVWSPINISESVSKNVAISSSIKKKVNEDLSFNLNAGLHFTNSKKTSESFKGDPTKDKFLPFIPLQSANVNLGMRFKLFEINLFYSHTGKRYSDFANRVNLSPFNIIDGNIGYTLRLFVVAAKVRFEINNITNADYKIISGYPMPLRNYQLTLSLTY